MKKSDIITAYRILAEAKLSKLETADKFKAIRALSALKPYAVAHDDLIKEARERLRPDNWADTEKQAQKWDELDEQQRAAVNRAVRAYDRDVADCAAKSLAEEAAPEHERLSEEAFGRLLDSNPDLTAAQIALLQEVVG